MKEKSLKNLKFQVSLCQEHINFFHANRDYDSVRRSVKEWSVAVKNYNEAVSKFLLDL